MGGDDGHLISITEGEVGVYEDEYGLRQQEEVREGSPGPGVRPDNEGRKKGRGKLAQDLVALRGGVERVYGRPAIDLF